MRSAGAFMIVAAGVAALSLGLLTSFADGPSAEVAPALRKARIGLLSVSPALPEELTRPEGRSRWDLAALSARESITRTTEPIDAAFVVLDEFAGPRGVRSTRTVFTDPSSGDAARVWLYPDLDRDALRPGTRTHLEIDAAVDGGDADRLSIDTEITGIG